MESSVVFDSSVYMMSKMELSPDELETVKVCRLPTTVIAANGSIENPGIHRMRERLGHVLLLEDTPAVLFLGKLCEENGYSYKWTEGHTPHLSKSGKIVPYNCDNFVPTVLLGRSSDANISGSAEKHRKVAAR